MSVRRLVLALGLAAAPIAFMPATAHETVAAAASVPKSQLLKPPANATHYVVVSDSGKHGDQCRWQLPEGSTAYSW
jgi:hypothetical protein